MFKAQPNPPEEVTGHKLSQISGIDPRRISDKKKKGELKLNKNGLYDFEQSMKALGIPIDTMPMLEEKTGPINIVEMRAIKERETAYLKRLERGVAEGQLLPIEKVLSKMTPLFTGTKVRILSLPAKLAPVLTTESNAAVIKAILEGELRVILAELASGIERELGLEAGRMSQASSADDDQRVGRSRKSPKSGSKRRTRKVAEQ